MSRRMNSRAVTSIDVAGEARALHGGIDRDRTAVARRPLDVEIREARELLAIGGGGIDRETACAESVKRAAAQCPEIAGTEERHELVLDVRAVERIVQAEAGHARHLDIGELRGIERLAIFEIATRELDLARLPFGNLEYPDRLLEQPSHVERLQLERRSVLPERAVRKEPDRAMPVIGKIRQRPGQRDLGLDMAFRGARAHRFGQPVVGEYQRFLRLAFSRRLLRERPPDAKAGHGCKHDRRDATNDASPVHEISLKAGVPVLLADAGLQRHINAAAQYPVPRSSDFR
jgi:hypothetical protein